MTVLHKGLTNKFDFRKPRGVLVISKSIQQGIKK